MTLAELSNNQVRFIEGFSSGEPHLERLQSLGVIPGAQAEILRSAPLGDPLQVRVDGTLLSIRISDARKIKVST